jgi:hypothetical protein
MVISRGQIRLVLQRPTIVGTRRFGRAVLQRMGDAGRWLERRIIPGWAPTVKLLVAVALTFVGLLFIARYVIGLHYWSDGDEACHEHEFRCGLAVHVGGTAIVAILAYYLVFLRREANAAGRWRRRARTDPNSLFAWLPPLDGLTGEARTGAATIRRRLRGGRVARWLGRRRARKALVKSIISRRRAGPVRRWCSSSWRSAWAVVARFQFQSCCAGGTALISRPWRMRYTAATPA